MTEEIEEKQQPVAYKVKLSITKEQHKLLMKMSSVYNCVKSWYIKELLKRLKENEYTVLTDWKVINSELNPRKMSTYFTPVKRANENGYGWVTSVPESVAASVFENMKTNWTEKFKKRIICCKKICRG